MKNLTDSNTNKIYRYIPSIIAAFGFILFIFGFLIIPDIGGPNFGWEYYKIAFYMIGFGLIIIAIAVILIAFKLNEK